jgi:hypothetical protein
MGAFQNIRTWIWLIWLPIAMWLFAPQFREQLGPQAAHPAYRIAALVAVAAMIPVWLAIRKRSRWADAALLTLAIAPALVRAPIALAYTFVTLLAAFGLGDRICRWLKLELPNSSLQLLLPAALGFGAWILILIALSLADLLYATAVSILLLVCASSIATKVYRIAGNAIREWKEPSAIVGISIFFLALMILILMPVILAPSTLYDSLATHLAASRDMALHHGIVAGGEYSYLPQGFELMMGAAYLAGGQPAEQMIAPMFFGLAMLALYAIARELGARRDAALAAVALAAAIPFVQWTGANAKNDLPMTFFLLAALLACLRAFSGNAGWILAGAFLAAASENVKHTALLGIVPLAILFLIAALRLPQHRALTIAFAVAIFLAFGSFWWIRSAITHHDALYPVRAPDTVTTPSTVLLPMKDRLAFLLSLQFQGTPVLEGNSTTRFGPFFLLFLPTILWISKRDANRQTLTCAFFIATYLAFWYVTLPVLRYAVVPIALLAIGLISCAIRTNATPLLIVTMILCHLATLLNLTGMSINLPRLEYAAYRLSADGYLSQALPSYPAIAWVRDHAPDSRILAIGTHALAYAPDPSRMDSPMNEDGPFDPGAIRKLIEKNPSQYVIITKSADLPAIFGPKTPVFDSANFAVYQLP